ncbi:MAG: hypothetical protein ACMUHY_02450 [Thermoplasmatota archaeon]
MREEGRKGLHYLTGVVLLMLILNSTPGAISEDVYDEEMEPMQTWFLGSVGARKSISPVRTSVGNVQVLDPDGKWTDEVFAFRGNHTLRVSGYLDVPVDDFLGMRLNFTWRQGNASILIDGWGKRPYIYGILPLDIPFMKVDLRTEGTGSEDWWFEIPFGLKIDSPDNCSFSIVAMPLVANGSSDNLTAPDCFTIHTGIEIGGYAISTVMQGLVSDGDWIMRGDTLNVTNISVSFRNRSDLHPLNGTVRVYLNNGKFTETRWDYRAGEIGELSVKIEGEDGERVNVSLILTDAANNEFRRFEHWFLVDGTPPYKVRNLRIHADDYNDANIHFDNDHEVFVTWNPPEDEGIGVAGYRYCLDVLNFPGGDNSTESFFTMVIPDVGKHRLWLWAVDGMGFSGSPDIADFIIDTQPVNFSYPDIDPSVQHNVKGDSIEMEIAIHDDLSGVDLMNIQYRHKGLSGNYSPWTDIHYPGGDNIDVIIGLNLGLDLGVVNHIQVRANDLADNGFVESGEFLIMPVDPDIILVDLISPSNGSYEYKDADLVWRIRPDDIGYAVNKLHLFPPDGSHFISDEDDTTATVDISVEGIWRWYVEIEVGGHIFRSEERTIRSIPLEMDVSIPTKMGVEKGRDLIVPVHIHNDVGTSCWIKVVVEQYRGKLLNVPRDRVLDPDENITLEVRFDIGELEVGTYNFMFSVEDEFGRSGRYSMKLEVEDPGIVEPTPKEDDGLFWALVILAMMAVIITLGVFVLFFFRSPSPDGEPEE